MDKENVVPPSRKGGQDGTGKSKYFGPSETEMRRQDSQVYISTTRQPMLRIDLITPESFIDTVKQQYAARAVNGLVWDSEITMLAADRTVVINFKPELEPEAKPYLEGNCARVMTAASFIDFAMRSVADTDLSPVDAQTIGAIAAGAARPDKLREVKGFSIQMRVCGAYHAALSLSCEYQDPSDGTPESMVVRCINAAAVRRALITETLDKLPQDIYRYHGRAVIGD